MITDVYTIQSHGSVGSASCTSASSGDEITCCDVTDITSFALPMNFTFGVTESAHGNTEGATLLGLSDSLSQYRVSAVLLSKAGVTLSVGSTISSSPIMQRGICTLWFVIGKLILCTTVGGAKINYTSGRC